MSPDKSTISIKTQNKNFPIIFAEDDPVDQEMILRAINKIGFAGECQFVENGAEALEYINATGQFTWRTRQTMPKVIVLDIRMPKMSGLDVLKKLRGDETTKHIPVIIFTSSTADYDCIESYKLGANSFIVKPFNFEDFQKTVIDMVIYWLSHNKPIE